MDGVHGIVAADEEIIADIVPAEHFQEVGKIGGLQLVTAASQGRARRRAQALDGGRGLAAQVDHVAAQEAFDAESHAEGFLDGRLPKALLDDSAKAGIDHAGGTAALADDGITVKHETPFRSK